MTRRQILRWRVHVQEIRVEEHRDRLEDPETPLRGSGIGGNGVEEGRCPEGVAQEDQAAGGVECVDDDRDVAGADFGAETADVEDDDQGNKGDEEGNLE